MDTTSSHARRSWGASVTPWFARSIALALVLLAAQFGNANELHSIKAGKSTLHLQVPDWPELQLKSSVNPQMRAWWTARLGRSSVNLSIWMFDKAKHNTKTPLVVADMAEDAERDTSQPGGDARRKYDTKRTLPGPYGVGAYGVFCTGDIPCTEEKNGEQFLLCGVLDAHAYYVRVEARPPLSEEHRKAVVKLLEDGIRADYPVRDPKWTAEEVKRVWNASVTDPKVRSQQKRVVRTKYHILLTNATGGSTLAKQMAKNFEQLHKLFPDGAKGKRRLLPLFYFRRANEFVDFRVQQGGTSRANAKRLVGFSAKDYYATHAQSKNDPTHMRGATMQYFRARLWAEDGAPWFRQGLSYYMTWRPKDLKTHARVLARTGTHMPFRELFAKDTLMAANQDSKLVLQAASIIRFLRESEKDSDRFMALIKGLGRAPRGDLAATEAVIEKHLGTDPDGLEARWRAFWKKK